MWVGEMVFNQLKRLVKSWLVVDMMIHMAMIEPTIVTDHDLGEQLDH